MHLLQGVPKDLFADCVIVPVEVSTSAYVRMYVQIADKMLMPPSHFHHSTGCSINGAFHLRVYAHDQSPCSLQLDDDETVPLVIAC